MYLLPNIKGESAMLSAQKHISLTVVVMASILITALQRDKISWTTRVSLSKSTDGSTNEVVYFFSSGAGGLEIREITADLGSVKVWSSAFNRYSLPRRDRTCTSHSRSFNFGIQRSCRPNVSLESAPSLVSSKSTLALFSPKPKKANT